MSAAVKIGRKAIRLTNEIVNILLMIAFILLLVFGCYAIWDSDQVHYAADKSHYAVYKPTAENGAKSFQELQSINPEVFAWLTIYGTNIDYPVTQGSDNMKYVNTNAEGKYSLSGAIFLDFKNSRNFSDFNSIFYGHHMQKKMMFGEIGNFSDKSMFDSHKYGNLFYDGKDHGVEFFAFIHTSAYDGAVFTPNVKGANRQVYLDNLLENAMYKRDIGVTIDDNIILLTTCSATSTNGRDILVGRITDEIYEDPNINTQTNDVDKPVNTDGIVKEIVLVNMILAVLLTVLILVIYYRQKNRKRSRNNEQNI
jgi:sortase B